jgi:hypothetical protein
MVSTSSESGQAVHSDKLHAGGDGDAWFARRVIAEELQWRAAHTHRRDKTTALEFLPAREIAGI